MTTRVLHYVHWFLLIYRERSIEDHSMQIDLRSDYERQHDVPLRNGLLTQSILVKGTRSRSDIKMQVNAGRPYYIAAPSISPLTDSSCLWESMLVWQSIHLLTSRKASNEKLPQARDLLYGLAQVMKVVAISCLSFVLEKLFCLRACLAGRRIERGWFRGRKVENLIEIKHMILCR